MIVSPSCVGVSVPPASLTGAVDVPPSRVGVPGNAAPYWRSWERLFGYSTETLFPDLDGFARANHWTADLGDLSPWAPPEGEVEPEPPDEPLPDDDDDEWGFE
jgi:hypothetical protein